MQPQNELKVQIPYSTMAIDTDTGIGSQPNQTKLNQTKPNQTSTRIRTHTELLLPNHS